MPEQEVPSNTYDWKRRLVSRVVSARQRGESSTRRTRSRFDGRSGPVRAGESRVLRPKHKRGVPDVAVVIDMPGALRDIGQETILSQVLDTVARALRGRSANICTVVRAGIDSAEAARRFAKARDRSGELQEGESIMTVAVVADAHVVIVLTDGNTEWPERWHGRGAKPVVCLVNDPRNNEGEVERVGGAIPSWADVVKIP